MDDELETDKGCAYIIIGLFLMFAIILFASII